MKGQKICTWTILLLLGCEFSYADYTAPSASTISSARQLFADGYQILPFFKSLKNLYLSNGFDMGNPINAAILEQPEILPEDWTIIIEALQKSREEIRDGDIGLRALEQLIGSSGSAQALQVLKSFKKAIRQYTNTTDDYSTPIDLFVAAENQNPLEFLTSENFQAIQDPSARQKFLEAASSALQSLNSREIKNSLVAAARLIQNVGEPKYLDTIGKVQGISDKQKLAVILEAADNLTLRFKSPESALKLIQLLRPLSQYFPNLKDLLKNFKFLELSEFQEMLRVLISLDPSSLANELQVLGANRKKLAQFQKKDKNFRVFGDFLKNSKNIKSLNSLIPLLRSTDKTKYSQLLANILQLSFDLQDGSDIYYSLKDLGVILQLPDFFQDLKISPEGSFPDYLDTVRMLNSPKFADQEKLRRKFLSGNPDGRKSLAELGIEPTKIATWIHATRSLEPTVALLKASGSREALGKMLGFHGEHTTNQEDPDKSVQLIRNIIKFMRMDGGFEARKRSAFRFAKNGSAHFSSN